MKPGEDVDGTTARPTIFMPALLTMLAWMVDATGSFDRPSVMMTTVFEQSGRCACWKTVNDCWSAEARFVEPPMKVMALQAAVTDDAVLYWVRPKTICESVP